MKDYYDFAFSFANEDRQLVEEIAEGLREYNIFYDANFQSKLCGKDLYSYLRDLYKNKCKYVVCFISKYYKIKVWTNLEFSAIKERLMATFFASDFLIPIVIDSEGILKDIPSFIGYYRYSNVLDTVKLLKEKYSQSLNEDFYMDNIKNFRKYICHEITSELKKMGLLSEFCDGRITIIYNSGEKNFFLVPESFSNLPCILLYESEKCNSPSAIITWERQERLVFSWNPFTVLVSHTDDNLTIKELVNKMTLYFIKNLG